MQALVSTAIVTALTGVVLAVGPEIPQADRPLPEVPAFVAEVRARLDPDRDVLSQYTYMERREEISVSALGKVQEGPVKVYEVHPSREPGNTWKRLISVDGKPLSPAELEENDRIHFQHVRERRAETASVRARRLREEAKERAEMRAAIDELFDLYEIRLVGRERLHGRTVIKATLDPKPAHRPRTPEGKWMKKLRLRAWVDEADYEVVAAEADVLDDITVGWGLIGRLHTGTTGRFERTKVNDEVWLPRRARINATGRSLVFRRFAVDTLTEWWGYKRVE